MINIRERPAEVEDLAVPGQLEGNLILGAGNHSAISTLMEHGARFLMLLHLPEGHTAEPVHDGHIKTMMKLPEALLGSLT